MKKKDEQVPVDLAGLRERYTRSGLLEKDLPDDPLHLFRQWITEAVNSSVAEPNAMSLSTVKADGTPDARMVLLKGIEEGTLFFFSNYDSEKARDLEKQPQAAGCIWWPELERQIRFVGSVEKLTRAESEGYFARRPRESQIGAWASRQSEPIAGREVLQRRVSEFEKRFEGSEVPCPERWGGYRIIARKIEFWQGRPGRLHDRIRYRILEGSRWKFERLSP
ncbi:MAG: pyridoxamine 5'-phosphate oxidase [Bacteroidota bacterium]